MNFFFDEKYGDNLSTGIRLKEINKLAKNWDHPMKGIFKSVSRISEFGDIYALPKKERETYCTSLMALALMSESKFDWWVNMPKEEPPDGLIATFVEKNGSITGMLREIEVVEYRNKSDDLYELIKKKMTRKAYASNTVLACLVLSPEIYDFRELAIRITLINSSLRHVFMVFSGAMIEDVTSGKLKAKHTYTMVQLLPKYEFFSFSIEPFMEDFKKRYEIGQESRLIEGEQMFYGTANLKFK